MSEGGKKRTLGIVVASFVLGVIATRGLSSFLSPFFDAIEEFRDDLLCPNDYWCQSHQTFKAAASVQCQDGNVGRLVARALNDGDLRSPQTIEEEFASRAYLCAELSWKEKNPLDHLEMLATRFESCFAYQPQASPAKGSGKVEPKFSVQLGHEEACLARVYKPAGKWKVAKDDSLGRVFCFPDPKPDRYVPSTIVGLRRCTLGELKDIDMPEKIREGLASIRSQE